MAKVRRMAGYSPKAEQIPGLRKKPIKKADYIFALEVAGQPATTKKEKAIKAQAKKDVKYLEAKFPKFTAKNKSFSSRVSQPTHTGKSAKKSTKKK